MIQIKFHQSSSARVEVANGAREKSPASCVDGPVERGPRCCVGHRNGEEGEGSRRRDEGRETPPNLAFPGVLGEGYKDGVGGEWGTGVHFPVVLITPRPSI